MVHFGECKRKEQTLQVVGFGLALTVGVCDAFKLSMDALIFFGTVAAAIFALIIAVVWIVFPFRALNALEAIRQELEWIRSNQRGPDQQ